MGNDVDIPTVVIEEWATSLRWLSHHQEVMKSNRGLAALVEEVMVGINQQPKLDLDSTGLQNVAELTCACGKPATRIKEYASRRPIFLCDEHAVGFVTHLYSDQEAAGRRKAVEREALGYSSDESSEGEVIFNKVSANVNREL